MTYQTPFGEFHHSGDVQLDGLGTSGSEMLTYLGWAPMWYLKSDAINSVNAAEARGVSPMMIATWRGLIESYAAAGDKDSLLSLQLEANGWTSEGNAGPITQQAKDAFVAAKKDALDALNAAKNAATSGLETVAFTALGLAVLYVVLKARK